MTNDGGIVGVNVVKTLASVVTSGPALDTAVAPAVPEEAAMGPAVPETKGGAVGKEIEIVGKDEVEIAPVPATVPAGRGRDVVLNEGGKGAAVLEGGEPVPVPVPAV